MSTRPSRHTVGLIISVALVVIGAVIAAFVVFGGGDGSADPEPTSPPATSQPPTDTEPSPLPPDCFGTTTDIDPGDVGVPVETHPAPEESTPPDRPGEEPTDPQPSYPPC